MLLLLLMPQVGIGHLIDHLLHRINLAGHHADTSWLAKGEVCARVWGTNTLLLLWDHGHTCPHHLLRRLEAVIGHHASCSCCLLLLLMVLHTNVLRLHLQLLLTHHLFLLHVLVMLKLLLLYRIDRTPQLPGWNGHLRLQQILNAARHVWLLLLLLLLLLPHHHTRLRLANTANTTTTTTTILWPIRLLLSHGGCARLHLNHACQRGGWHRLVGQTGCHGDSMGVLSQHTC